MTKNLGFRFRTVTVTALVSGLYVSLPAMLDASSRVHNTGNPFSLTRSYKSGVSRPVQLCCCLKILVLLLRHLVFDSAASTGQVVHVTTPICLSLLPCVGLQNEYQPVTVAIGECSDYGSLYRRTQRSSLQFDLWAVTDQSVYPSELLHMALRKIISL